MLKICVVAPVCMFHTHLPYMMHTHTSLYALMQGMLLLACSAVAELDTSVRLTLLLCYTFEGLKSFRRLTIQ